MRKMQEGAIVIGKKKVWKIFHADDIVLPANNQFGFNMLKYYKNKWKIKALSST